MCIPYLSYGFQTIVGDQWRFFYYIRLPFRPPELHSFFLSICSACMTDRSGVKTLERRRGWGVMNQTMIACQADMTFPLGSFACSLSRCHISFFFANHNFLCYIYQNFPSYIYIYICFQPYHLVSKISDWCK